MTKPTINLERLTATIEGLNNLLSGLQDYQKGLVNGSDSFKQFDNWICWVKFSITNLTFVIEFYPDSERYSLSAKTAKNEEGKVVGEGELTCWARGPDCPDKPCGMVPGECGVGKEILCWARNSECPPSPCSDSPGSCCVIRDCFSFPKKLIQGEKLSTLHENKAGRLPLFAQLTITGKLAYNEAVKASSYGDNLKILEAAIKWIKNSVRKNQRKIDKNK